MKKLIIYKTIDDKNIFDLKKTKIFKIKDGKKYLQNEEIIYIEKIIKYNENLYNELSSCLELSLKEAKDLSQEPIDISTESFKKTQGMIFSTITKHSYLDLKNHSIFDFITELFIKILKNHYLKNGNKRLAIAFLKISCWNFGYYFKFSKITIFSIFLKKQQDFFWKKQEKKLLSFVTILHNYDFKNQIKKDKIFDIIKNWINNNVFIAINFR